MSLSFLIPNRTVLLVADGALYIYASESKGPRLVDVAEWDVDNFEEKVAAVISKDCGGKPVLILNDMVEQHYRKERVMKAGFMDNATVLKRKLNMTFPNYPVRAAFPLKEKQPKGDKKISSAAYIFAAIPESKQFQKTLAAVSKSLASVSGFCLLPIEASDMVKTLSAKVKKSGEAKTQWVAFVGQHKNGGLRQIVVKNGELALTRMTPVIDSDANPEEWADDVFQEFNATMSYLARFGFNPEDGLHVIAIANTEGGEVLHAKMDESYIFSALTAEDAAKMLDMPLGAQEDLRYADPLHVAWAGRKNKFILPMKSAQVEHVSQPRQVALLASVALCVGIAYLGYQMVNLMGDISSANSQIQDNKAQLAQATVEYQKIVQRKEALGFDIRLIEASTAVYDALEKNKIDEMSIFNSIGQALGKEMRVDKISITRPAPAASANGQPETNPGFQIVMQMTYPSTTNIEKGNQEVKDLGTRLQSLLKGDTVEVTKLLKDYQYSEGMVVETGDLKKPADPSKDFTAEITIKGKGGASIDAAIKNPAAMGAPSQ